MFSKFQTPMRLKIDLDQVHFTELGVKKKIICQQQKTSKQNIHLSDF